jgi:hypothetical protein
MDDVERCGTPWRWRWPHRLGFIFSAIGLVLAITTLARGVNDNVNLLTWSVASLSLGMTLLSASSLAYRKDTAASAR